MLARKSVREVIQKAMHSQDVKPTAKETHAEALLKGLQLSGDVVQDPRGLWHRTRQGANNQAWPVEVLTRLLQDASARRRIDESAPLKTRF